MNGRKAFVLGAGALYIAVGAVATAYLAGLLLFVANRVWPSELRWDTWWSLYRNLDLYPAQARAVWGSMLAAAGLVYVILPLTLAAGLQRPRPLFGDARFARYDEVRRLGLLTERPGIIVGKMRGRYLVFSGQQFVLMAAPTRSGKGVGVVIPNLLNWPDSVIVTDIKGENFEKTSGFRQVHGQEVYLFAPFAEDGRTHRWNPFDGVSADPALRIGELLAIAQALYPSVGTDAKTAFWNEQAQNILLGLALFLIETPGRRCSLGELFAEASGRGRPIRTHLTQLVETADREGRPLSTACRDALARVSAMSGDTLASAMATFNGPLIVYANPMVAAATEASDFDLTAVRRRRMSIYLVIPPSRLADAGVLLNLFYTQLLTVNTHVLPEQDEALRYQCLLLMDEFTAMGRLPILAKAVGYLAGYNLRLLPVIQSHSQLRAVYGDQDARTFVTNHALQIVFAPRELQDAKEYSEALGDTTELRETHGRSRSYGGPLLSSGRGASESSNRAEQRRALMLPQELRELDPKRQIVFLEGSRPILCDKIRYYVDQTFLDRLYTPATIPQLARASADRDATGHEPFPEYDRRHATDAEIDAIARYVNEGGGPFAPGPHASAQTTAVMSTTWDLEVMLRSELDGPAARARYRRRRTARVVVTESASKTSTEAAKEAATETVIEHG